MKTPISPLSSDLGKTNQPFSDLATDYFPAILAGLIAVLISYAGPMLLMVQAAQAAHLSKDLSSSWLWAVSIGSGICSIGLSYRYKTPVICAWNTPGAALLVTGLMTVPYNQAIGAYLVAAAITFLIGATGAFNRLMSAIPKSLCAAMLAGILFRFGVEVFANTHSESKGAPWLTAIMFFAYLAYKRQSARYAVVLTLMTGVVVWGIVDWDNQAAKLTTESVWHFALTKPIWSTPEFSVKAIISLAIPLAVLCLTGQQVPGIAVLRAAGFDKVPVSKLISVTGFTSLIFAPFGAHGINLAAITAAICTGSEAHQKREKRWIAGVACGIFYVLIGCFAGSLKDLFLLLPHALVSTVAGLALLGAIQNGLVNAMAEPEEREAALITFIVTASNLTLLGLGAACWGILLGIASHLVLRKSSSKN
ncbi:benzoate/H(+) symporter BenE family transporter [Undibacterium jejuense]|uniref:Benzoate/H(+) symporter BenE family transporter n=1 Tax=Undibacterium jejuense TaxID=1344949 RepID=A0A923HBE0_9BURK|nr:benzoate/H(+) symporter BenE family transporter [Undibacterium jejuense]MBC3860529.1 benzoate/H(+) symporter BenE family transporter [Undibacterium jejuense]